MKKSKWVHMPKTDLDKLHFFCSLDAPFIQFSSKKKKVVLF